MNYYVEILEDLLVEFPKYGQFWALSIPFSADIVKKAMEDPHALAELKAILQKPYDQGLRTPEQYIMPVKSSRTITRFGWPNPAEYIDDIMEVDMIERARLGLIANTVATVQLELSSFLVRFHKKPYGVVLCDIFDTLLNPARLLDTCAVAAFVYAGIRNELILPMFGSVEDFYSTFILLKERSKGFIQAIRNLRHFRLDEARLRALFDSDDDIQAFISLQLALQPHRKNLLEMFSMEIALETFVPIRGENPAVKDEEDPIVEMLLGYKPEKRKWLLKEEKSSDCETSSIISKLCV